MGKRTNPDLLHHAAQRARDREAFVASALHAYQALHNMGDDEMAAFLGCSPANLPRLALCRRPDAASTHFRAGVDEIAAYAGVDRFRLAELLREADAVRAFQARREGPDGVTDRGVLLAARDHTAEEADEPRPDDVPDGDGTGEP